MTRSIGWFAGPCTPEATVSIWTDKPCFAPDDPRRFHGRHRCLLHLVQQYKTAVTVEQPVTGWQLLTPIFQ